MIMKAMSLKKFGIPIILFLVLWLLSIWGFHPLMNSIENGLGQGGGDGLGGMLLAMMYTVVVFFFGLLFTIFFVIALLIKKHILIRLLGIFLGTIIMMAISLATTWQISLITFIEEFI